MFLLSVRAVERAQTGFALADWDRLAETLVKTGKLPLLTWIPEVPLVYPECTPGAPPDIPRGIPGVPHDTPGTSPPGGVPRATYKDFWSAFVSVYLVVIGENWNEYMYEGIKATSLGAVAYFLSVVVVGNFVMLNLFLAIFLDGFDCSLGHSRKN